jgi:NAD(P)-dependent dehydrogenase (short-subunit alcohol dehydrogenase family)
MKEKTVLVIGATGAIGAATVRMFAHAGAKVVMVARNKEKAEKIKKELSSSPGNGEVSIVIADMSDFTSLRKAAAEINAHYTSLDIVIAAAAVYKSSKTMMQNKYEETFATNYLGYFILVNALLDKMKASPRSLFINVCPPSSKKLDFADLQQLNSYGALKSFNNSSLVKLVFTNELARRVQGTTLSVINYDPGFVKNETQQQLKGAVGVVLRTLAALFAEAPENTAGFLFDIAGSSDKESLNGKFYRRNKVVQVKDYLQDAAIGKELWEKTVSLLGEARGVVA